MLLSHTYYYGILMGFSLITITQILYNTHGFNTYTLSYIYYILYPIMTISSIYINYYILGLFFLFINFLMGDYLQWLLKQF